MGRRAIGTVIRRVVEVREDGGPWQPWPWPGAELPQCSTNTALQLFATVMRTQHDPASTQFRLVSWSGTERVITAEEQRDGKIELDI